MNLLLRIVAVLLRLLGVITLPLIKFVGGSRRKTPFPQIRNEMLEIPAVDLAERIRNKELRSEDVVRAYIDRIREVNPLINAVVEERFTLAIEEAKKADEMIANMQTIALIKTYPLLGVPFTVKESCALKGALYTGGSLPRKGIRASADGEAVSLLRAAGCIPLLVSNTPEYCLSWESYNHITGRTVNPYDNRRTAGGSSGGEGALIGAGASLFGVGSDVAGSIRVPALFNGIFGHKPTADVISIKGHFPMSSDDKFRNFLTVGPMCRYAKDLPTLLHIMAGSRASKLRLDETVYTKQIKIYYMEDVGFNVGLIPVDEEIKIALFRAVQYFKDHGLQTERAEFDHMDEIVEMGLCTLKTLNDIPNMFAQTKNPKDEHNLWLELGKSLIGLSQFTLSSIFFYIILGTADLLSQDDKERCVKQMEKLKKQMIDMLGTDGVLFIPTFPKPAIRHYESICNCLGVVYTKMFNALGFPGTHVPLGFNKQGLPIGIQIVAAPYQDRLSLCIARELEAAFGGWKPPK